MQPYEATPSDIRVRSLREHQRLRDAASRLIEQARACDCAELRAPLSQAIDTLIDELRAHLEREDAALGPVLADIDPWGPQRVARLREHRRIELARLADMVDRLAEPLREGPLGPRVLQFVAWIEAELAREESEELDAGVLRDGPVVDGLDGEPEGSVHRTCRKVAVMITLGRRAPAPTDLVGHLLACHERIRRFVALAETAGSTDGRDGEVVEACAAVERYFERALPLHLEDEEQSILPRLRGRRVDVDEALRTMASQHQVHVPLVEELLVASRSLRRSSGDPAGRERLRVAAAKLAAEFGPHLLIEERIIFPAVGLLGAEAQAQIRGEQRTRRDGVPAGVP